MGVNYIDSVAASVEESLAMELRPKVNAMSLYRSYALLALTVGENVTLENVHDAWSSWKAGIDPDHDAIRPFSELDGPTREIGRAHV